MSHGRAGLALAGWLTGSAFGLAAQQDRSVPDSLSDRAGLTFGVAAGLARAQHASPPQPRQGLVGAITFGWAIPHRVILTGEAQGWTDVMWPADGQEARGMSSMSARGTWFVLDPVGVRGGVGYGQLRTATVTGRTASEVSDWGWQVNVGITAEPLAVFGFRLAASLDVTRFLWLRYGLSSGDQPLFISLRMGLMSY